MISHDKKLIFIHVPKTGGKKISEYLYSYCDEESLRFSPFVEKGNLHAAYYEYLEYYGKEIKKYKVVSVVRNPWEKALSQYLHLYENNFHPEIFESTISNFEDHGLWSPSHFGFFARQRPPSSPSWGRFRCPRDAAELDHYEELIKLPTALKFENFEEQVSEFFDYFDIKYDSKSLKKKVNPTSHDHYSYYYTPVLRDTIVYWAGYDLQVYNYDFRDMTADPPVTHKYRHDSLSVTPEMNVTIEGEL